MNGKGTGEKMFAYLLNTATAIKDTVKAMDGFTHEWAVGNGSVYYLGMGGSAIAGDFAGIVLDGLGIRSTVVRGYSLPPYFSSSDLAVAISYSGNTEETLTTARDALRSGAMVIGISSGGKLKDLMDENGMPHIPVPQGYPPRSAVGYLFPSAVLAALGGSNPGAAEELLALADLVEKWSAREAERDSASARLASEVVGRLPVVYAVSGMETAARRWATQLNENSKILAFHGSLPEMNHNELVGWSGERPWAYSRAFAVVLDNPGNPRLGKRVEFFLSLLAEKGVKYAHIVPEGDTPLERAFYHTIIGDALSIHLAEARGIDPEPVEIITRLKKTLAGD